MEMAISQELRCRKRRTGSGDWEMEVLKEGDKYVVRIATFTAIFILTSDEATGIGTDLLHLGAVGQPSRV